MRLKNFASKVSFVHCNSIARHVSVLKSEMQFTFGSLNGILVHAKPFTHSLYISLPLFWSNNYALGHLHFFCLLITLLRLTKLVFSLYESL